MKEMTLEEYLNLKKNESKITKFINFFILSQIEEETSHKNIEDALFKHLFFLLKTKILNNLSTNKYLSSDNLKFLLLNVSNEELIFKILNNKNLNQEIKQSYFYKHLNTLNKEKYNLILKLHKSNFFLENKMFDLDEKIEEEIKTKFIIEKMIDLSKKDTNFIASYASNTTSEKELDFLSKLKDEHIDKIKHRVAVNPNTSEATLRKMILDNKKFSSLICEISKNINLTNDLAELILNLIEQERDLQSNSYTNSTLRNCLSIFNKVIPLKEKEVGSIYFDKYISSKEKKVYDSKYFEKYEKPVYSKFRDDYIGTFEFQADLYVTEEYEKYHRYGFNDKTKEWEFVKEINS